MKSEKNLASSGKSRKAPAHLRTRDRVEAPGFPTPRDLNGGLRAQISIRAYELYVQRGYQEGHDLEDWLEAERQVLIREEHADREVFSGSQA